LIQFRRRLPARGGALLMDCTPLQKVSPGEMKLQRLEIGTLFSKEAELFPVNAQLFSHLFFAEIPYIRVFPPQLTREADFFHLSLVLLFHCETKNCHNISLMVLFLSYSIVK
jgi:hypothetical protein